MHLSSLSGNVLERLVEEHLLQHVARARRLARGDERREAELLQSLRIPLLRLSLCYCVKVGMRSIF